MNLDVNKSASLSSGQIPETRPFQAGAHGPGPAKYVLPHPGEVAPERSLSRRRVGAQSSDAIAGRWPDRSVGSATRPLPAGRSASCWQPRLSCRTLQQTHIP